MYELVWERLTNLEALFIAENDIAWELPIHSAGANSDLPRRDVGHSAIGGAGVPRRADDHNAMLDSVEGANGDAVVEERRGGSPERHRQDVHAVMDGAVECSHDVRVEALVAVHGGPADLVGRDSGPGRSAFGGAVAEAEDACLGDEVTARGREGVRAMAFTVSW